MSALGRWLLGSATLVVALGFVALGCLDVQRGKTGLAMFALAAFSGLIAAACYFRRGRTPLVRLIGLVVVVACVFYVLVSWRTPSFVWAGMAFLTFGLPAAYVVVTGRYPAWGQHAGAFGDGDPD